MMQSKRLLLMTEIAVMSALAFALSTVKLFSMPQGGSVSLVMLPIALLAYRRGLAPGLTAGLIVGILNFILDGSSFVHPIQLLLDYPLAFLALGLAGVARLSRIDQPAKRIAAMWGGLLLGVIGRLVCHFTSGVVWFAEYAPEGTPVAVYSFVYNITYLLPEMIITGIVLTLILSRAPQLFFIARGNVGRYS